LNLRPTRY